MHPRPSPAGAIGRGLLAGLGGTAAMTAWQEAAAKLQSSGSDSDGGAPPPQTDDERWEQASTPAKAGKRLVEGLTKRRVPASRIGLLTNVMHWGYGTGWGAVYGIVQGTRPAPALRSGLAFGALVWVMSYVQLVPLGLYEPPWQYGATTLGLDLSYHLAYGAGLGATHAVVAR